MMLKIFLSFSLLFLINPAFAQYLYSPSTAYPFGKANPKAPEELLDFAPLIGICDCKSYARNNFPDTTWKTPEEMIWSFKYIMNGMAIQDETLKNDGIHSGSIRQFNQDSSKWYVHYYTNAVASPSLSAWEGNKTADGKIILYKEQKAPNGMDGYYKITFHHISKEGFDWLGEWVSIDESLQYPTWKIHCVKRH